MIKVCRIGHATFETTDLEKQSAYYAHVLGLVEVAREKDRVFFAARTGQLAIELQRASAPRCAKLSFEVAHDADFAEMSRRLTADFGTPPSRTPRSGQKQRRGLRPRQTRTPRPRVRDEKPICLRRSMPASARTIDSARSKPQCRSPAW